MRCCTKPRSTLPDARDHSAGFTLVELLVASTIGLLILALGLSSVISNRRVYKQDIVRTRLNQNLRSAMDIIGMNVRQGGEALVKSFPVIEIQDGGANPDQLIIRRNLYENEVLNICQNLAAGSVNTTIRFAYNTTQLGCAYNASLLPYLTTWIAYKTEQGGSAKAYAFNRATKQGEFFVYNGGQDTGTQLLINRSDGLPWQYAYTGDGSSAAMYILEESRFRVQSGVLQIVQNADTANPLIIVDTITSFQVVARMMDGTTKASFATSDSWTGIKSIEVTISAAATFAKQTVTSSLTSRLFPRNILSN